MGIHYEERAVWKSLLGWVRGSGVPSSKESMGESQLVGCQGTETPQNEGRLRGLCGNS